MSEKRAVFETCNRKPIGPVLIVKVADDTEAEETFQNSMIVRAEQKKNTRINMGYGTVIAVGTAAFLDLMEAEGLTECPVKVGDVVEFDRYEGKAISMLDDDVVDFRYVRDFKVWGIIEEDKGK